MEVEQEKISILLYADDIMFGENKEEMQEMLDGVNEFNKLFDAKD